MRPTIMKLFLRKAPEFYITIVGQINKGKLKVIPIVKGKVVGIDLLIKA